jgi:L-aminopeptidase/D-esterase-like protein
MMKDSILDVPGFRVGQVTDEQAITGCTVILCPPGTVGAADMRGGAPGTRETDLLQPGNLVEEVHAVVLSGGSAFGLSSAHGVMRFLSERGIGYRTASGYVVPIVPAAILFDLHVGDSTVYPDEAMGYQACLNASDVICEQGSVGAGTGALCGAMMGKQRATKGGIGTASVDLGNGLVVAAIVAVNPVGDVLAEDGTILAGLRGEHGYSGMMNIMRQIAHLDQGGNRENTVIGAIVTNARLTKSQLTRVAQMAHDGIGSVIRPAHTLYDGDTVFALACGDYPANVSAIGAFAAEVMARAIRNGVRHARSMDGVRVWDAQFD